LQFLVFLTPLYIPYFCRYQNGNKKSRKKRKATRRGWRLQVIKENVLVKGNKQLHLRKGINFLEKEHLVILILILMAVVYFPNSGSDHDTYAGLVDAKSFRNFEFTTFLHDKVAIQPLSTLLESITHFSLFYSSHKYF